MQMTEAFAGAVTVSIPIFALAAGAEARTIRERLKRPDQKWEGEFERYGAEHDLDLSGRASDVFAYFRGVPGLSKLYVLERVLAICAAIVWLVVFVLLTIAEVLCLLWLGDGAQPGDTGLATYTLAAIAAAMVTLIIGPTVYLALPLMLPLDVIPRGLKEAVVPKLAEERGRGFMKHVLAELEGAVDRATEKYDEQDAGLEAADRSEDGQVMPAAGALEGD